MTGTALPARLSLRNTTSQSISVELANRPLTSRLGVIAVGARPELLNKAAALGTGANANYETCTHCFAIAIGCTATDCKQGVWFYAKSGAAVFTQVAAQSGEKFEGKFSDVTLEQVSIDWNTAHSTPVRGAHASTSTS